MLVTPDFPPGVGGIQAVLWNTVREFDRVGVTVVAPDHPDASAFDHQQPFEVRRVRSRVPFSQARFVPLSVTTLHLLGRGRGSVLLCGHAFTSPIGLAAKRVMGIPFVVWAHAKELLAWQPVLRHCLPAADAVLVISGHTGNLVRQLGVSPDRMVPIPYAPDCDPGAPSLEAAAGDAARPILLTVARLDELYKGHDVMLRALPLIAAKVPGVQWVVVGDGPLRDYYEALARALGMDGVVRFVGAVTREARDSWLRRCDLFVMLSRDRRIDGGGEGFGIALLEANAFGKPVVAGRAGGVTDAVVDGVTGLLVDPENAMEVADSICRLLSTPAEARRLGHQGRARIRTDLSWSRTAAAVEDVLVSVARGH